METIWIWMTLKNLLINGTEKTKELLSPEKRRNPSVRNLRTFIKQEKSVETAKKVKSAIISRCRNLAYFSGYSPEPYLSELGNDYRSVYLWSAIVLFTGLQINKSEYLMSFILVNIPDKRKNI